MVADRCLYHYLFLVVYHYLQKELKEEEHCHVRDRMPGDSVGDVCDDDDVQTAVGVVVVVDAAAVVVVAPDEYDH